MHMANELLSLPVATGTLAIAAAGLGFISKKLRKVITPEKFALMGVLGAFIFAAQMVNIQLPAMPGVSCHMVGAVLLAIILGPHAGAIAISSVVIIQCLIFQDGGLLAIGCNIINIALVPSYLGYFVYRSLTIGQFSSLRTYAGTMLACVIAIESGAILVLTQAVLSGVLAVPFLTFLITLLSVHFLVGFVEGLITVAVLGYLQQVRPDIVAEALPGKVRLSKKNVLITLAIFTLVIGAGLSLLASDMPDGLEWSYAQRPELPDFEPFVANDDSRISAVDGFQSKYSLLPDYSRRSSPIGQMPQAQEQASAGWKSFAGIVGSVVTMLVIWAAAWFIRRERTAKSMTCKL